VALIVENGGSGGAVAGPIARQVIDRHLLGDTTQKVKADAAQ
jgi:penicillin-binding protein 2